MSDLSPRQERAVLALLTGASLSDAARAAGVTPRTLYRWRESDAFKAAYRRQAREAVEEASNAVLAASGAAVAALRDVMGSGPPGARVAAARTILEAAERAVAADDDARLDRLEAEVRAWRHDRTGAAGRG